MIEKPFILDPGFADLVESGAFRERVYKLLGGMSGASLFGLLLAMNLISVITAILGFVLEPMIFLATAIFGGLVNVAWVIVALNWLGERGKRERMRRLAFDSDLVTGRIVTCERKCYRGSTYQLEVQFAATTPDGKEVKWTQAYPRDDLLNEPLPPPGWPVLVLMVDETLFFML